MSALDFTSVRHLLEQAVQDVGRQADLSVEQEKALRHAMSRSTELGILWQSAAHDQRQTIESEIKALRATLLTLGETKAIELAQLVESRLNSILTRGIDMLLDRVIGPN